MNIDMFEGKCATRKTVDGFSVAGVLLVPLAILVIGLPWPLETWAAFQIALFAVVSGIAGWLVVIGSVRAHRRPGRVGTIIGPLLYLTLLALSASAIIMDKQKLARRIWLGRALGKPSEIWHACYDSRERRGHLPGHIGIALREGIVDPKSLVIYATDFNADDITINGEPLSAWLNTTQDLPTIDDSANWIEAGDFLFARNLDEKLWMNQDWIFAVSPPASLDDNARAVVFGGGRHALIHHWSDFRNQYNESLPNGFAPIPDWP